MHANNFHDMTKIVFCHLTLKKYYSDYFFVIAKSWNLGLAKMVGILLFGIPGLQSLLLYNSVCELMIDVKLEMH